MSHLTDLFPPPAVKSFLKYAANTNFSLASRLLFFNAFVVIIRINIGRLLWDYRVSNSEASWKVLGKGDRLVGKVVSVYWLGWLEYVLHMPTLACDDGWYRTRLGKS